MKRQLLTAALAVGELIVFTISGEYIVRHIQGREDALGVFSNFPLAQELFGGGGEPVISHKGDIPLNFPRIVKQNVYEVYEAEDCPLNGLKRSAEKAFENRNFSGGGYVEGFSKKGQNTIYFDIDIPTSQHYDFSLCLYAEKGLDCTMTIDGKVYTNLTIEPPAEESFSKEFTMINIPGIFVEKGPVSVGIRAENGDMQLDYLSVRNNTSLDETDYNADHELCNENASASAKELMYLLSQIYGKYMITGQYVSTPDDAELELIYNTTGRYPVIRFSAFHNEGGTLGDCSNDIQNAVQWSEDGGVVGYMWNWECPGRMPTINVSENPTDFRLQNAVTDLYIAEYSPDEIQKLFKDGHISEECVGLIEDIDEVSQELLKLKEKKIPVLWRPLHEASGEWYWWGAAGSEVYNWLWKLVYNRMTYYHGLNNLIWIWNGQSADTLVQENTFDIASIDVYSAPEDFGSRYEQFTALRQLTNDNKLLALTETNCIPDMDTIFRDNTVWSFFGMWNGAYIIGEDGGFSEKFMSSEEFSHRYNSVGAMTLDEFGDFKKLYGKKFKEPKEPEKVTEEASSKAENSYIEPEYSDFENNISGNDNFIADNNNDASEYYYENSEYYEPEESYYEPEYYEPDYSYDEDNYYYEDEEYYYSEDY